MIVRALRDEEKEKYNQVVGHPLQSWEWGEFRKQTGTNIERVGFFHEGKLSKAFQVTFHPLPVISKYLNKTVGYLPKGFMPDEEQIHSIIELGKRNNALFVKLEPNIAKKVEAMSGFENVTKFLLDQGAVPGRPLFTKFTYQLDLTQTEEKLFKNLESKTRYNVRLAVRSGVEIFENTSKEGMDQYIEILEETMDRQGFYAHTPDYFRKMWESLGNSGMIRIFNAVYQDTVIVSWVMFVFNGKLYYPYGASRNIHRNVMASNLMMWEMIKFGKREGLEILDMWGSLGPEPNKSDPWYGFHKFKKGYGGDLMEFLGTYDLVIEPNLYKVFRIVEKLRWKWLRLRTHIPFL